ncbi:MAG: hypothetical protein ACTSU2_03465 [Promethearchaeota archaeon]
MLGSSRNADNNNKLKIKLPDIYKLFNFSQTGIYLFIYIITSKYMTETHRETLFMAIFFGGWFPLYLTILSLIAALVERGSIKWASNLYIEIALFLLFPFIPLSWLILILLSGNFIPIILKVRVIRSKKSLKDISGFSLIIIIIIAFLSTQVTGNLGPSPTSKEFSFLISSETNNNLGDENASPILKPSVSFFVEWYFTADDVHWMFSKSILDNLVIHNSSIYLLIPESNFTSNSFAANVTRLLNSMNISVWAWLALNISRGYYFTDETAGYFPDFIANFLNWSEREGLTFKGVMLDIEPNTFHRDKITDFMFGHLSDDLKHSSSAKIEEDLIKLVHSSGLEIAYCGPDLYIDDSMDRDDDLIQIFGLPAPIEGFDKYIIMTYRSLYPWTERTPYNYYLYSSVKNFRNLFGDSFVPALATIGKGVYSKNSSIGNGLELLSKDIKLASAMGVKEITLWCLEWLLWFDWDNYSTDLEQILNSTSDIPDQIRITINPIYFEFRSILYFIDFMSNFKF